MQVNINIEIDINFRISINSLTTENNGHDIVKYIEDTHSIKIKFLIFAGRKLDLNMKIGEYCSRCITILHGKLM